MHLSDHKLVSAVDELAPGQRKPVSPCRRRKAVREFREFSRQSRADTGVQCGIVIRAAREHPAIQRN